MQRGLEHLQIVVGITFLGFLFLSRPLTQVGFPSLVNMVHLSFIPLAFFLVFLRHQKNQVSLLLLTSAFWGVCLLSGAINSAGNLNVLLLGLIMTEPFILYLLLTTTAWSRLPKRALTTGVDFIMGLNFAFAGFQVLAQGHRGDDVRGIFIDAGAGSHLNGSVGLCYAIFVSALRQPEAKKSTKVLVWVVAMGNVWLADAKTGILCLAVALGALALVETKRPVRTFAIGLAAAVVASMLFYYVTEVIRITNVQRIVDGFTQKFAVIGIINHEMSGVAESLFGLGPGHSISRVATMLPHYEWLSQYFHVTIHPLTDTVLFINQEHYLTNSSTGSSVYSMYNSWVAVWGDVGVVGFITYAILWYRTYKAGNDDIGIKLLVFFAVTMGLVFIYLGEPGFTGAVILMIAASTRAPRSDHAVDSKPQKLPLLSTQPR